MCARPRLGLEKGRILALHDFAWSRQGFLILYCPVLFRVPQDNKQQLGVSQENLHCFGCLKSTRTVSGVSSQLALSHQVKRDLLAGFLVIACWWCVVEPRAVRGRRVIN